MNERESHVRTSLRHVQKGRAIIRKQYEVIERLHASRLPTLEAENVLKWLKEVQRSFEESYGKVLEEGQERLRAKGYKDPTAR